MPEYNHKAYSNNVTHIVNNGKFHEDIFKIVHYLKYATDMPRCYIWSLSGRSGMCILPLKIYQLLLQSRSAFQQSAISNRCFHDFATHHQRFQEYNSTEIGVPQCEQAGSIPSALDYGC
jgi:hypothetical protein